LRVKAPQGSKSRPENPKSRFSHPFAMKDKKDEAGQAVIQLPRIQNHEE
jgi:hypothetical protein